jgi:pilus assembly protein Flp/PilA
MALALVNYVRSFARTEEGQDLLEYALLVALIAVACVTAITGAKNGIVGVFGSITSAL